MEKAIILVLTDNWAFLRAIVLILLIGFIVGWVVAMMTNARAARIANMRFPAKRPVPPTS